MKQKHNRQSSKKARVPQATERTAHSRARSSYSATEAKNEFGSLLDQAIQGFVVVITKHGAPRAVLISMEKLNTLQHAPQLKLDTMSAEFDAVLARMQSASERAGMERAFNASPSDLGKAALAAARKRG
jgi:prevent-host-death family protein